ncbi:hypothetical protein Droror1_Dr00015711 [Drosera rotundifolia]
MVKYLLIPLKFSLECQKNLTSPQFLITNTRILAVTHTPSNPGRPIINLTVTRSLSSPLEIPVLSAFHHSNQEQTTTPNHTTRICKSTFSRIKERIMKSDRKPPLVRSPMRIPPRRSLRSNSESLIPTPSGYKSRVQKPKPDTEMKQVEIKPEYTTISCELTALAKMVKEEFGRATGLEMAKSLIADDKTSLFERGRFYDEYSARRNERLKRKKRDETRMTSEPRTASKLGVKLDSAMKRETKRRESLVRSVSVAYSVPRYALRSIKKPPPPLPMNIDRSGGGADRKTTAQRARRN